MASLSTRLFKHYARVAIKTDKPANKQELVQHLRRTLNNAPLPRLISAHIAIHDFHFTSDDCIVVAGDHLQVPAAKRVVLYLHGGGYVAGVTATYHNFCGRIASALSADIFLPDYRLAPEHPFPAAVHDALATYRHILSRGYHAQQICVIGDSAGGGLTLALLLMLRDHGLPLPACAAVLSPLADMSMTAESLSRNDRSDAMLSRHMLRLAGDLYARQPEELSHPYVSPAYGDFSGLPPLLITVSEEECLRDDAYSVAVQARQAGVTTRLLSRNDMPHVWPIFVPFLPEARQDLRHIIRFLRRHLQRLP